MLMFATFPILGITQGFLPIAGFNYGAKNWIRVRNAINISIGYATFLASLIFAVIFFFAESIPNVFSDNQYVANHAPTALRYVFVALPIVGIQLIGAAYFQAIGKALPALLLTLSRQGIFFIPLLFILPRFYGVDGVWMAFPIADVLSTIVTGFFLNREVSKLKTT
jgi:Na+-driven multidrug efflux pump